MICMMMFHIVCLERNKINNFSVEKLVKIEKYFCTVTPLMTVSNEEFNCITNAFYLIIYQHFKNTIANNTYHFYSNISVTYVTLFIAAIFYFAHIKQLKKIKHENQR